MMYDLTRGGHAHHALIASHSTFFALCVRFGSKIRCVTTALFFAAPKPEHCAQLAPRVGQQEISILAAADSAATAAQVSLLCVCH